MIRLAIAVSAAFLALGCGGATKVKLGNQSARIDYGTECIPDNHMLLRYSADKLLTDKKYQKAYDQADAAGTALDSDRVQGSGSFGVLSRTEKLCQAGVLQQEIHLLDVQIEAAVRGKLKGIDVQNLRDNKAIIEQELTELMADSGAQGCNNPNALCPGSDGQPGESCADGDICIDGPCDSSNVCPSTTGEPGAACAPGETCTAGVCGDDSKCPGSSNEPADGSIADGQACFKVSSDDWGDWYNEAKCSSGSCDADGTCSAASNSDGNSNEPPDGSIADGQACFKVSSDDWGAWYNEAKCSSGTCDVNGTCSTSLNSDGNSNEPADGSIADGQACFKVSSDDWDDWYNEAKCSSGSCDADGTCSAS